MYLSDRIKTLICDMENPTNTSALLRYVAIRCGDYEECLGFVDEITLFYIDSPYRPLAETSSFTSYKETDFNDKEKMNLGDLWIVRTVKA